MQSVIITPVEHLYGYKKFVLNLNNDDIHEIEGMFVIIQRLLDDCKRVRLYLNRLHDLYEHKTDITDTWGKFDRNLCLDGILIELYKITEGDEQVDRNTGEKYRLFNIRTVKNKCIEFMKKYDISDSNAFIFVVKPEENKVFIRNGNHECYITDDGVIKWLGQAEMIWLQDQKLSSLRTKVSQLQNLRCKTQAHQELNYLMNLVKDIEVQDILHGIANKQYINGIELENNTERIREDSNELIKNIQKALVQYLFIFLSIYQRQLQSKNTVRALNIDDVRKMLQDTEEGYIYRDSIMVIKSIKVPR